MMIEASQINKCLGPGCLNRIRNIHQMNSDIDDVIRGGSHEYIPNNAGTIRFINTFKDNKISIGGVINLPIHKNYHLSTYVDGMMGYIPVFICDKFTEVDWYRMMIAMKYYSVRTCVRYCHGSSYCHGSVSGNYQEEIIHYDTDFDEILKRLRYNVLLAHSGWLGALLSCTTR